MTHCVAHLYTDRPDYLAECCEQDIRELSIPERWVTDPDLMTCSGTPLVTDNGALDGSRPIPQREALGRLVRRVWVKWAREQAEPTPSWLVPWERLDPGQREVDMRIGEAVYAAALLAASIDETVSSECPDEQQ
jgi:hypothetical protein